MALAFAPMAMIPMRLPLVMSESTASRKGVAGLLVYAEIAVPLTRRVKVQGVPLTVLSNIVLTPFMIFLSSLPPSSFLSAA